VYTGKNTTKSLRVLVCIILGRLNPGKKTGGSLKKIWTTCEGICNFNWQTWGKEQFWDQNIDTLMILKLNSLS